MTLLIKHFNKTITKDEVQKQFSFQVVEKLRTNFAEYNRELLAIKLKYLHNLHKVY